MELCVNGCNDVWNSRELQEVLDLLLGKNKERAIKSTDLDDILLYKRIEAKVRRKLQERKNNAHLR
mgnify:CR=1 FL=1